MARRKKQTTAGEVAAVRFPPAFFDEERHHEALEQLTVQALSAGDAKTAFRFADRRCRISPLAQAHHYTLRAEASYQLKDRESALRDISRALELLPEDLAANRRMLAWGSKADQVKAAEVLLRREPNLKVLPPAITLLRKSKRNAFATVQHTDTCIFGWAAWSNRSPLKLRIDASGENLTTTIAADPKHPLGKCAGHAASFVIARPQSQAMQTVSLTAGKKPFYKKLLPPAVRNSGSPKSGSPERSSLPRRGANKRLGQSASDSLTVIVPVYDDYEATTACLDSLVVELKSRPHIKAILVDDASPDGRIAAHLMQLAEHESIRLIANEHNLGFVESVNLALAEVKAGDVILLNADTIVPPGFAERLRAAARSRPNIGTVVPLSNNGEFTSIPVPNTPNPMGSAEVLAALDAAAAVVNAGKIVDIPNGTGFCLYITRQCLDAVGMLSDIFERGYLEDADFCLRAREAGFLSVCAPSIYVGHAGSRSFGDEKRALVMRNMGRLEARYPAYRNECAMFLKADPLRESRAAVERQAPSLNAGAVLLIRGPGPVEAVVAARSRHLAGHGTRSVIAECRTNSVRPTIRVVHPSEGLPQSLEFAISQANGRQALANYLDALKPSRIELAGLANLPAEVLDLLFGLNVPSDVLLAEAGLVREDQPEFASWQARWREALQRADHLYAPDAQAAAFAKRYWPHPNLVELDLREGMAPIPLGNRADGADALGILALRCSAADHELIRQVARGVTAGPSGHSVVVIGRTLDDLELMKTPGVTVTGAAADEDIERLLRHHDIKALFVAVRQPLFGHTLVGSLVDSDFPLAVFDWSSLAEARIKRSGLAIDPSLPGPAAAQSVRDWLARV
jgi:GT2 family glycosyltransferase